jgi:hypothetical protein
MLLLIATVAPLYKSRLNLPQIGGSAVLCAGRHSFWPGCPRPQVSTLGAPRGASRREQGSRSRHYLAQGGRLGHPVR